MKKILIITHTISSGGGAEKILNIILKFINKEKYQIDILEIKNFGKSYNIIDNINYLGHIRSNKNNILEKLKDKIYLFLLVFFPKVVYKKFIKKEYDIKISFNYLVPSFLITSINDNSKKICWIHSSIEDLNYKQYKGIRKIEYKLLNYIEKKTFYKADYIVPISKKTKESIENIYPSIKSKLKLIYNGFDFKDFDSIKAFEKENYIVISGRIEKRKNFSLAVDVINELVNNRKINIKLLILGEGVLKKQLENKIRKLNLEEYIKLKGYIKEPYEYVKKAKVMLMTSFSEGFPTVIVESLALKTPVISTPVAGTDELLYYQDKKCGEITTYEVKDIADKIENLLLNEELYKTYQELGYKNVKHFSVENQLENLEKLLEN